MTLSRERASVPLNSTLLASALNLMQPSAMRRWSGTINVAYEEVNSISRASHPDSSLAFLMLAIRSFDWNVTADGYTPEQ